MGLPFHLSLYAESETQAEAAARAAFARVAELNHVFSDYEDDSELTLLSRTSGSGRAVPVSEELWRLLNVAQAMSRRSDGAFDITTVTANFLDGSTSSQDLTIGYGFQHFDLNLLNVTSVTFIYG